MKRNIFKTITKKIHLYVGLLVGLIVFIISLTGALYVFKNEFQNNLRKDAIWHQNPESQKGKPLPIDILLNKVKAQIPNQEPLGWITVPVNKEKSYEFHFYKRERNALTYDKEFIVNKTVYVDPFSGKIIKTYDEKKDFFFIVLRIHYALLLGSSIGSWVTGFATLAFLIMSVTGIILWWPRNRNARKQRFWFNWRNIKNWKRKNYDLHSIVGFYASFFAVILSITGLFYAFKIVPVIIYFIFSGGNTELPNYTENLKSQQLQILSKEKILSNISEKIDETYPASSSYNLMFEGKGKTKKQEDFIAIQVMHLDDSYHIRHTMYFDKNNGELLLNQPYEGLSFGEKVVMANYDIHVGAILGIWGKTLAFITSSACASLPITGFLVWWGRRKRKN